jgi:PleD family two-component response regulator
VTGFWRRALRRAAPETVEQMVSIVDGLMYAAKTSGKNRLEKRVVGE